MIGKLVRALILIPLAIVLVCFAVANRQRVLVSFDPFDNVAPAFAVHLPLFVLILVLLILGVVIGGVAAWLRQNKWRRAAHRHEQRARMLQMELDAARARAGDASMPKALPPSKRVRLTIPPPAA